MHLTCEERKKYNLKEMEMEANREMGGGDGYVAEAVAVVSSVGVDGVGGSGGGEGGEVE